MGIIADLVRSRGLAERKLYEITAAITGTGSVITGLSSVEYAHATVVNSGTAIATDSASITSISNGTIAVVVTKHEAAANSVESAAKNVCILAIGY